MRHLTRGTVFFVAFFVVTTLLLAIVVGCAQAHQTGPGRGFPASTSNADRAEDTASLVFEEHHSDGALICLALVGGTALLAGGVWFSRLRRLLP